MNTLPAEVARKVQEYILLQDLSKTNTVLSGRRVECIKNMYLHTPAATEPGGYVATGGPEYVVKFNTLPASFDAESLVSLLGLNYHELAHVLYTFIKSGDDFGQKCMSAMYKLDDKRCHQAQQALNLLEDMRIEALLTTRYRNTIPYLQAAVSEHIVEKMPPHQSSRHESVMAGVYVLTGGRDYYSAKVRRLARKYACKVYGTKVVLEIDGVIRAYKAMGESTDVVKAAKLALRLDRLLHEDSAATEEEQRSADEVSSMSHEQSRGMNGYSNGKEAKDDDEQSEEDAEETSDEAFDDSDDTEDTEDTDTEDAGGASGASDDDDTDESGEGDGSASGDDGELDDGTGSSASGPGDGRDDEDADDEDTEGEGGKYDEDASTSNGQQGGNGAGKGNDAREDAELLKKHAEQDVQNTLGNSEVAEEINNTLSVLTKGKAPKYQGLEETPAKWVVNVPPDQELISASNKVAAIWQRTIVEEDPGRLTHQSSGSVNMRRAIRGDDFETIFDVWSEGQQDTASIEVVTLLDTSGSMLAKGKQVRASRALWVLHRAANKASSHIAWTNIIFNSSSRYLVGRSAKAPVSGVLIPHSTGGTNTLTALYEAEAIFATSDKQKKVLIVLTDGIWTAAHMCEESLRRMEAQGVITSMVYVPVDTSGSWSKEIANLVPSQKPGDEEKAERYVEQYLRHGVERFIRMNTSQDLITFTKALITGVMTKKGK